MGYIASIDKNIWMVIGVIVVILFVLACIKKAIKLAITLFICVIISVAGYVVKGTMDDYNIKYIGSGQIMITIDEAEYTLAPTDVENIALDKSEGDGLANLEIQLKSGDTLNVEVSNRVGEILKQWVEKNHK